MHAHTPSPASSDPQVRATVPAAYRTVDEIQAMLESVERRSPLEEATRLQCVSTLTDLAEEMIGHHGSDELRSRIQYELERFGVPATR